MSSKIKKLDIGSFARLLGATKKEITDACGDILSSNDFRYTIVNKEEKDNTLLTVLKAIDTPLSVSGKGRKEDWEKGWSENLQAFKESNYDLSSLVPKYMHKSNTRRLFSEYIKPLSSEFEVNFYTAYRHFLFRKYLSDYQNIYEFGCGTGYNLVIMAQIFPDKALTGLDWAASSVKLVNQLAARFGFRMRGRSFDYFNPDYFLDIADNAAFITLNSLEQIGSDHDQFIRFVLNKKPAICINSEPLVELYDQNNLLDHLAVKYHHKRNYLHNYLGTLRKYEDEGLLEIIKTQRVQSGNLFHDGYSYVVWKAK